MNLPILAAVFVAAAAVAMLVIHRYMRALDRIDSLTIDLMKERLDAASIGRRHRKLQAENRKVGLRLRVARETARHADLLAVRAVRRHRRASRHVAALKRINNALWNAKVARWLAGETSDGRPLKAIIAMSHPVLVPAEERLGKR